MPRRRSSNASPLVGQGVCLNASVWAARAGWQCMRFLQSEQEWTTRGGNVLEIRAQATCTPAVSPSSFSGRMAILLRSAATACVTSRRWSSMKASLPMGKGSVGSSPSASPKSMRTPGVLHLGLDAFEVRILSDLVPIGCPKLGFLRLETKTSLLNCLGQGLKDVCWGSPSYVMAMWLRCGLMTSTGSASKTLTASSQAGLCGRSSRRTFMHVLRSMVPKAFLKSRQATTCVGLSARCALRAVVIASPPWGVPMPNCLSRRKTSKSDLAGCRQKVAEEFGPEGPYQCGSDGPSSFV